MTFKISRFKPGPFAGCWRAPTPSARPKTKRITVRSDVDDFTIPGDFPYTLISKVDIPAFPGTVQIEGLIINGSFPGAFRRGANLGLSPGVGAFHPPVLAKLESSFVSTPIFYKHQM